MSHHLTTSLNGAEEALNPANGSLKLAEVPKQVLLLKASKTTTSSKSRGSWIWDQSRGVLSQGALKLRYRSFRSLGLKSQGRRGAGLSVILERG